VLLREQVHHLDENGARVAAGFRERRAADRGEHVLVGAERVLVAGQDDRRRPARERLVRLREERALAAARGDPQAGGADAQRLHERTSRERHG
jgi:hypothetical protein